MLNRIRQLTAALGAQVKPQERKWVDEVLPLRLQPLFYEMDEVDQRHALDVAADALKYAEPEADKGLLTQAALLHDCGKHRGELNIALRIFVVMTTGILADKARRYARKGQKTTLRHALWLYFNHSGRGAEQARNLGAGHNLCKLVAEHHIPPGPGSSIEQVALYLADQKN